MTRNAATRRPNVALVDNPSASRDQWLYAGQTLLRRGGAASVKLHALTAELGLTTGSFYHHFRGMADYLEQLANLYGTEQAHAALAAVHDPEPRTRLRTLAAVARREDMATLDAAMRDWAGSNPEAAESVEQADHVMSRFIETAFVDLGYPRAPRRCALLFYSEGVTRVSPPWKASKLIDAALAALARSVGPRLTEGPAHLGPELDDRMAARTSPATPDTVTRAACDNDARGFDVVLTPAGLRAIQTAAPLNLEAVRHCFIGVLTDEQLDALGDIAEAITTHLESEHPCS